MFSYFTEIGYLISTFHGAVRAVAFAAVHVSALSSEAGVDTFLEERDKSLENTASVKKSSFLVNQTVISKYMSLRIVLHENTMQQQWYHRCSLQKVSFYKHITNFRMLPQWRKKEKKIVSGLRNKSISLSEDLNSCIRKKVRTDF